MQNPNTALDYAKIGHRIKVSRKEENLSQEALAEKCATTSRYLSDIENGKCRPSLDLLARICVALDVSIDSLLYDSPLPYTGYLVKNAIPGKVEYSAQSVRSNHRFCAWIPPEPCTDSAKIVHGFRAAAY